MAPEPADGLDLGAKLARAIDGYRATWRTVDAELYDLCRRRPSQRIFADVYAKVAVIGRVYVAGVSRSSHAPGDREAEMARGLIGLADLIEETLADLAGRQFDRATAAQIVEPHTGDVWLPSFVSKYLHFHCDRVPIYDSNAASVIGCFVDRRLVADVRALMTDVPVCALAYRKFVAAFVVLQERINAETSVAATVKEVDHLLWQSA